MGESFVLLKLCRLRDLFTEGQTGDETLARFAREIAGTGKPKLLSRRECADLLRVSLPTLDKYVHEEGLPYRVKNPNAKKRVHYVFDRDEVLEWQKSRLSDLRSSRRSL
jgi:predicted DNA-binding transcriptional regulator AlpA